MFSRVPGTRVVTVGQRLGVVGGPGGAQRVEVTFESLGTADIVAVPGGLGSHRHPEISAWLRRVEPRWVLTNSTGSALLAAGGLLCARTAATHWLAGPLLERHGVTVSPDRLVVDGPYVDPGSAADAAVPTIAEVRFAQLPGLAVDPEWVADDLGDVATEP